MSDAIIPVIPHKEPKENHCPICGGVNSPHQPWEPNSKLGGSWWKRVGFNAPNACALAIREKEIADDWRVKNQ